jgi:hypothetical protein
MLGLSKRVLEVKLPTIWTDEKKRWEELFGDSWDKWDYWDYTGIIVVL